MKLKFSGSIVTAGVSWIGEVGRRAALRAIVGNGLGTVVDVAVGSSVRVGTGGAVDAAASIGSGVCVGTRVATGAAVAVGSAGDCVGPRFAGTSDSEFAAAGAGFDAGDRRPPIAMAPITTIKTANPLAQPTQRREFR